MHAKYEWQLHMYNRKRQLAHNTRAQLDMNFARDIAHKLPFGSVTSAGYLAITGRCNACTSLAGAKLLLAPESTSILCDSPAILALTYNNGSWCTDSTVSFFGFDFYLAAGCTT